MSKQHINALMDPIPFKHNQVEVPLTPCACKCLTSCFSLFVCGLGKYFLNNLRCRSNIIALAFIDKSSIVSVILLFFGRCELTSLHISDTAYGLNSINKRHSIVLSLITIFLFSIKNSFSSTTSEDDEEEEELEEDEDATLLSSSYWSCFLSYCS